MEKLQLHGVIIMEHFNLNKSWDRKEGNFLLLDQHVNISNDGTLKLNGCLELHKHYMFQNC
jgi:hypothetical protein